MACSSGTCSEHLIHLKEETGIDILRQCYAALELDAMGTIAFSLQARILGMSQTSIVKVSVSKELACHSFN